MEKIKNITLRGTLVARVKVACCKKKNKNYHQKKKKPNEILTLSRGETETKFSEMGLKRKTVVAFRTAATNSQKWLWIFVFIFFFPPSFVFSFFFPRVFQLQIFSSFWNSTFRFSGFCLLLLLCVIVFVCMCVCLHMYTSTISENGFQS